MSKNRYKVEYLCDCGCDYGSCERKSKFIYEYNCSIDLGTLVHHPHYEDEKSKPEYIGCFTDNALKALMEILSTNETTVWEDKDHEALKESRGW